MAKFKSEVADTRQAQIEAHPWKYKLDRAIRESRMSQNAIADQAKVDRGTVSAWFTRDRKSVDIYNLMNFCGILGISIYWLFDDREGWSDKRWVNEDLIDGTYGVPVIAWGDIEDFVNNRGKCETMRAELRGEPKRIGRRFCIDVKDGGMGDTIRDGDTIDCYSASAADHGEIVIAWVKSQQRILIREIMNPKRKKDGTVSSARLISHSDGLPELPFNSKCGDRILAVVESISRSLSPGSRKK